MALLFIFIAGRVVYVQALPFLSHGGPLRSGGKETCLCKYCRSIETLLFGTVNVHDHAEDEDSSRLEAQTVPRGSQLLFKNRYFDKEI